MSYKRYLKEIKVGFVVLSNALRSWRLKFNKQLWKAKAIGFANTQQFREVPLRFSLLGNDC